VNIIFGDGAKIEVDNAVEWYELQRDGLGRRFALAIYNTATRVSLFPESGTILIQDIRRVLINEFPFGMIYSIKSDSIEVLAIAHLHRQPMYWKDRL
jgi:hypothetical protein